MMMQGGDDLRCLATFDITSMAVMFERACRKKGIAAKIVPVPRSISASCGLACDFPCEEEEQVRALCEEKHIETASFHRME